MRQKVVQIDFFFFHQQKKNIFKFLTYLLHYE